MWCEAREAKAVARCHKALEIVKVEAAVRKWFAEAAHEIMLAEMSQCVLECYKTNRLAWAVRRWRDINEYCHWAQARASDGRAKALELWGTGYRRAAFVRWRMWLVDSERAEHLLTMVEWHTIKQGVQPLIWSQH